MISVVINADNRTGYLNSTSTVCEYGEGSLQGVRSVDLLVDGVKNKMDFFKGYKTQCILFIDVHEEFPKQLMDEIGELVFSYGNDSKIILQPHSKTKHRWNDHLYIDALKNAEGEYTVHFDMDCCAYKKAGSEIVEHYLYWLNEAGHKYVCQSWDRVGDNMYWASTRFFICKTKTLDFPLIERSLFTPLRGVHNPCFEHTIGILGGEGSVLYPPRNDDDYIIFCWAKYFSGLTKYLNDSPYEDVIKYLRSCGLYGTHDIIAKPITND